MSCLDKPRQGPRRTDHGPTLPYRERGSRIDLLYGLSPFGLVWRYLSRQIDAHASRIKLSAVCAQSTEILLYHKKQPDRTTALQCSAITFCDVCSQPSVVASDVEPRCGRFDRELIGPKPRAALSSSEKASRDDHRSGAWCRHGIAAGS